MTDDRSLERAARSWIESGPTRAPDRAVEAALLLVETTPQERDLRIPWRLPKMNPMIRFATVAIVAVIAVGGAMYFFGAPASQFGGRPSAAPATLEGTWEVTFTREEMLTAGITESGEDNAANYGHFKLAFHNGNWQLTQLTAPSAAADGWYVVSGPTLTLTELSREPYPMPYTVTDTTLTIGRGGPVTFRVKPWTRIGP